MRKPVNSPANREWLRKLFKLVNARIALREKMAWAILSRNVQQENDLRAELSRVETEILEHEANRALAYA